MRTIILSAFIIVSILLSVLDASEEKRSSGSYGLEKRGSDAPESYGLQGRGLIKVPKKQATTTSSSTPSASAVKAQTTTTTPGKPIANSPTPLYGGNKVTTTTSFATQASDVPGADSQLNGEQSNGSPPSSQQGGGEISAADEEVPVASSSAGIILIATVGGVFVLAFGLFAFVRKKKRQEITNTIVATSASAWEQQNSTYEKVDEKPINPSYTVVRTYMPSLSDELDIQIGDKVTILEEYDDGWVQGINETRGGVKGVFPRHCVDMNSSTSNKRTSSVGAYTVVDLD